MAWFWLWAFYVVIQTSLWIVNACVSAFPSISFLRTKFLYFVSLFRTLDCMSLLVLRPEPLLNNLLFFDYHLDLVEVKKYILEELISDRYLDSKETNRFFLCLIEGRKLCRSNLHTGWEGFYSASLYVWKFRWKVDSSENFPRNVACTICVRWKSA